MFMIRAPLPRPEKDYIYPGRPRNVYYLQTSFGDLQTTDNEYVLQTGNSINKFHVDQKRTEATVKVAIVTSKSTKRS